MVSKRGMKVRGTLYLFAGEDLDEKQKAKTAVDSALEASGCGEVTGSGISFFGGGTYMIDLKCTDTEDAGDVIENTLCEMALDAYEISWD